MRLATFFSFLLYSFPLLAMLHGQDDRFDPFDSQDQQLRRLAKSTAAMIRRSKFKEIDDFFYLLKSRPLEFYLPKPMCSKEEVKFKRQISVAECSGFLVAPDIIATAGHCVHSDYTSAQENCKYSYWVFDYAAAPGNSDLDYQIVYDPEYDYTEEFVTKKIPKQNVYRCHRILDYHYTKNEKDPDKYSDYALIQLDRKVTDRPFLAVNRSEKSLVHGDGVVAIGHPSGLPTKIAANAWVIDDTHINTFTTNLDAMQNNSGSAIFDLATGQVEGVLVKGIKDYIYRDGCYKVFRLEPYEGYIMGFKTSKIPWKKWSL